MKILIVGSKEEWALETIYYKHLSSFNKNVSIYPSHDDFINYYNESIVNKIKFRLGFSKIYKKINLDFIEYINQNSFDIIWVFKGMEMFPETLNKISKMDIKLINFNGDHPFEYSYRGSGNKNVLNSIKYYDLHLTYSTLIKEQIKNKYGIDCYWLPFAFEYTEPKYPKKEEEILRACFIGNPDKFRTKKILELAKAKIPVTVYGNQWNNWLKDEELDIEINSPIYKADFVKIAYKYRFQLNIFRPHNENSHNMRTFEMPGLGCIMLAPKSNEHSILFKESEEYFCYSNDSEFIAKCSTILNLEYGEALKVRKKAHMRSINSKYTYLDRTNEVFHIMKDLIQSKKELT
jgi:hypothetical protein